MFTCVSLKFCGLQHNTLAVYPSVSNSCLKTHTESTNVRELSLNSMFGLGGTLKWNGKKDIIRYDRSLYGCTNTPFKNLLLKGIQPP